MDAKAKHANPGANRLYVIKTTIECNSPLHPSAGVFLSLPDAKHMGACRLDAVYSGERMGEAISRVKEIIG